MRILHSAATVIQKRFWKVRIPIARSIPSRNFRAMRVTALLSARGFSFVKKTTYIRIFSAALIALFAFFAFSLRERAPSAENSAKNIPKSASVEARSEISLPAQKNTEQKIAPKEERRVETITLIAGSSTVSLVIREGQSLYDALRAPENAEKIFFEGREYSGLGFFITSIGSLREGGGKYLFFYVNGEMASSGISSYKPKAGDKVEWKLE